jgi:hypothetical protein
MKKAIIGMLMLCSIAAPLYANTSRGVPFSTLRYEAEGDSDSGKVAVEAVQNKTQGMLSVRVSAFGKAFEMSKEEVAAFAGERWHSVAVWQDSGLLGRTLMIRFDSERWFVFVRLKPDGFQEVSKHPRKNEG